MLALIIFAAGTAATFTMLFVLNAIRDIRESRIVAAHNANMDAAFAQIAEELRNR